MSPAGRRPVCLYHPKLFVCGFDGCTKSCATCAGLKRHARVHRHAQLVSRGDNKSDSDTDTNGDVVPQHHSDCDDHHDQVFPPHVDRHVDPLVGREPREARGRHIRWHPALNGVYPLVLA